MDFYGNFDGGPLSTANYDLELLTIPIREPGTCEWLLSHPSFLEWRSSSSSEILWLRGYPGVGKSVLAKYLITSVLGNCASDFGAENLDFDNFGLPFKHLLT